MHEVISSSNPDIDRVALANYDATTDSLATFVSSNKDVVRLDHYAAKGVRRPTIANACTLAYMGTTKPIHMREIAPPGSFLR